MSMAASARVEGLSRNKLQAVSPVRWCQAGPLVSHSGLFCESQLKLVWRSEFEIKGFGPRVPCIYSGAWNNYKV
jgi:hypothetical protein